MAALPLAPPGPVPEIFSGSLRWPNDAKAVEPQATDSGKLETGIVAVPERLRRVPGGRRRQVIVRLSDDEHDALQRVPRTRASRCSATWSRRDCPVLPAMVPPGAEPNES